MLRVIRVLAFGLWIGGAISVARADVSTVEELVAAVNLGVPGDVININAGLFELAEPLRPKQGMTLRGAGAGDTILTAISSWQPGNDSLPDDAVDHTSVDRSAYLIDLATGGHDVTIADMTLTAPALHGAVYGNDCDRLELYGLHVENFLWSSIRVFRMNDGRIHDNTFVDAGGRANVTSGQTGGAIFVTFTNTSEFWNNRIEKSAEHPGNFFGFKGRKISDSRFHHNTVRVGFSLEFPFENDRNNQIDHNVFTGPISIPKFAGGPVYGPAERSWHIHRNWLTRSYAFEWARNSAQINSNLLEFSTADDGGNAVSNFGVQHAPGPTFFFNNRIRNPGRGVWWSEGPYDRVYFYNNHVRANTLTRESGFFGFDIATNFDTVLIRDNIIENTTANERPLMRNDESYGARIENNTFLGISDTDRYLNSATGHRRGPRDFLFRAGVGGEFTVQNWTVSRTMVPDRPSVRINATDRPLLPRLGLPAQETRVRPAAGNDRFATSEGTELSVEAPGVLATDSNLHMGEASLAPILIDTVANGVLMLGQDGGFVYLPDSGFTGTDEFTYQVDNGRDRSTAATVTILVTDGSRAGD